MLAARLLSLGMMTGGLDWVRLVWVAWRIFLGICVECFEAVCGFILFYGLRSLDWLCLFCWSLLWWDEPESLILAQSERWRHA